MVISKMITCLFSGYLTRLSGAIVNAIPELSPDKSAHKDLLKVITKPFTKLIIQVRTLHYTCF